PPGRFVAPLLNGRAQSWAVEFAPVDDHELRLEIDVDGIDTVGGEELLADGLLAMAAADARHEKGHLGHCRAPFAESPSRVSPSSRCSRSNCSRHPVAQK